MTSDPTFAAHSAAYRFIVAFAALLLSLESRAASPSHPHKDTVRQVALSEDGSLAATWARDALRLWDVDAGQALCDVDLRGLLATDARYLDAEMMAGERPTDLTSLAITADGSTVLSGSRSGWVRGHSSSDCSLRFEEKLFEGPVRLSVSASGAWAAGGLKGVTVQTAGGERVSIPVEGLVTQLALDPTGEKLAFTMRREEFASDHLVQPASPASLQKLVHPHHSTIPAGHTRFVLWTPDSEEVFFYRYEQQYESAFHAWKADGSHSRSVLLRGHEALDGHLDTRRIDTPLDLDWNSRLAMGSDGKGIYFVDPNYPGFEVGVLPLSGGEVQAQPLDFEPRQNDFALSYRWAFDSPVAPTRAVYGDQNGNIAVLDLATRRALFLVDERAFGGVSESECKGFVDHLEATARASIAAEEKVYIYNRKELLAALAVPGNREKLVQLCVERAVKPDLQCYLQATTWNEVTMEACRLGSRRFP